MNKYFEELELAFKEKANPKRAAQQKSYLKNKFEHFGLSSPERRELQKPFLLKESLLPKSDLMENIKYLLSKPEREFHHFSLDFCNKYIKQQDSEDIRIYEYMILNKSWWDTIDFVAPKLVAQYFLNFPDTRNYYVDKWIDSGNIWLQRSAILFQLKYKDKLDTDFLEYVIGRLNGGKEFFINKAIGWILREHAKLDPDWVLDYVNKSELSNLSRREALKHFQ